MVYLFAVAIKGDGIIAPVGKWQLETFLHESAEEADKQVAECKSKGNEAVILQLQTHDIEAAKRSAQGGYPRNTAS